MQTLKNKIDKDGVDFPLSGAELSLIHGASVEVLSKTGFRFDCEKVQDIFRKNGFTVRDGKVYITEKDVYSALESVPPGFIIGSRNPKRDIRMGPRTVSFGMGRGAVLLVEPDGITRSATRQDVIASLKLGQTMDALEHLYPLLYPADVDCRNVHLWACQAAIKATDKPYNYANRDDIDLVALAYGTDRRKMAERTDLSRSFGHTTAIVHSPLTMTKEGCDNLFEYIQCGIALHVASMPIAGASGPSSIAGTIVLQNCENLVPIVFSQLLRPGCPVFYGALGGHADMMSLRPRFGTAEARIIEGAGNQMARFYGLLCRGNTGLTDAPSHDFQAGAQAMLAALSVLRDGPNFLTGCGLLGSYMGGSLAKMVLDTELVIIARRYLTSIKTDQRALAVGVIDEVGPGGHFVEHSHTLENYRSEFLTESIFRSPDYERWASTGKRVIDHLAHERALQIIDSYEQPELDKGLEEELDAYVERNWVHR